MAKGKTPKTDKMKEGHKQATKLADESPVLDSKPKTLFGESGRGNGLAGRSGRAGQLVTGPSEYDDGSDPRTPLQKDYGARVGNFGDDEGATFAGIDSWEEALKRQAERES